MTNKDAALKLNTFTHRPKQRGRDLGRPSVYIEIGRGDTSSTVDSVLSQFRNYNWADKLRSGQSYLVLGGPAPLHPDNHEAVGHFLRVLNPLYTEIWTEGHHKPPRDIHREVDHYSVDVGGLDSKTPEAIDFFADHSSSMDGADFHVLHQNAKKTKQKLPQFTREHQIYNHNVYLYCNDYEDDYTEMKKAALQHGWKVSPPEFDHFDGDE